MTKKKSSQANASKTKKSSSKNDVDREIKGKAKSLSSKNITTSSTAEYFSKNLQQVGFSSLTKSVLTTLKEALDNSLDACEENGILPDISVKIEKVGTGTLKSADLIKIRVEDNGPGIHVDDVSKVFGEYLASSKFGRGRCSRGQQGIGISAATTWAQLTTATGAQVITKTKSMRKALSTTVEVDIKNNKGLLKDKQMIDWDKSHGTIIEFTIDGRIQINGEAGLQNYLMGNVLVNPHMKLTYHLPGMAKAEVIERVSNQIPSIPEPMAPHPHTMKLGEFIAHSHLFGRVKVKQWLKNGFSRVSDQTIEELVKIGGIKKDTFDKNIDSLEEEIFRKLFTSLQNMELRPPSTQSVLAIGEEALSQSIKRLGEIDYFSVLTRKPTICDFKPVQIEVAIARLKSSQSSQSSKDSSEEEQDQAAVPVSSGSGEDQVQVLRFANRVPLQFDKAACAIVQSLTSVNWKPYGINQPKNSLPLGPYIFAVSVVSPFIKFKNASKETIDSSDELVEEIRRALMQAGQKLSRHLKKELKDNLLEEKIRHIEQFGPILVDTLIRITNSSAQRQKKAEEGLRKILGRDAQAAQSEAKEAEVRLKEHLKKTKKTKARDEDLEE